MDSITEIEKNNVYKVYDEIAEHFADTRDERYWVCIKEFIDKYVKDEKDKIFLDIGCGNGRYFKLIKTAYKVGCDYCDKFIEISKGLCDRIDKMNVLELGYKNDYADYIICSAVIHHLNLEEQRFKAYKEIIRVLKPEGYGIITVFKYSINKFIKSLDEPQDKMIKWHMKDKVFDRYYYFYKYDELKNIFKQFEDINVIDIYDEYMNWVIIIQKK